MTFTVAGLMGLGGPEVLVLAIVGVLIGKVVRRPGRISRYCPKCGRGLTQQVDAPFCCYCGQRLP